MYRDWCSKTTGVCGFENYEVRQYLCEWHIDCFVRRYGSDGHATIAAQNVSQAQPASDRLTELENQMVALQRRVMALESAPSATAEPISSGRWEEREW